MDFQKPKITIITVTYNAEKTLENTILSVINQTYPNKEYLIMDGNSKDKTKEIIKKYRDKITLFISEPDQGLYDAMNKGVKLAKGDWVIFMNSGDSFYNNQVLENIFSIDQKNSDIIYGDSKIIYPENFNRIAKALNPEKLLFGMICSHQATFSKVELLNQHPFNLDYKLACDYDFFLKQYLAGKKFLKLDQVIATVDAGGVSDNNRFLAFNEYKKILQTQDLLSITKRLYFVKLRLSNLVKLWVKKMLPKKLILKIKYAHGAKHHGHTKITLPEGKKK